MRSVSRFEGSQFEGSQFEGSQFEGSQFDLDIRRHAEQVQADLCAQNDQWSRGFTRRTFLGGAMVGVASLALQTVTTRVSYAATTTSTGNTMINVFLRGAADGLRILVPSSSDLGSDYLASVRGALVPSNPLALTGADGWALHSVLSPLMPFWHSGELAFVPAVADPSESRSHFQAQQAFERGGQESATTGWLDRTLTQLGPGTTFRAVAHSNTEPVSLAGNEASLAMRSLESFTFPAWSGVSARSQTALAGLYRGLDGPLGEDVPTTLAALATAATARGSSTVQNGATYPSGDFSTAMKDLATLIRAGVGLEVATVDVGGWDTHTDEVNQLDKLLTSLASTLGAFMTDLGPTLRPKVTVAVMTEFGRRVAMNDSAGSDHGHGGVMILLGGGLVGGRVHGHWTKLSDAVLDQGDVPGWNDPFDVLGEIVQKRLGVGSLSTIFPGHTYAPLGVATTV